MAPIKRARMLARLANRNPFLATLIVATSLATPGYFALQYQAGCASTYASKLYAAVQPRQEAEAALQEADNDVWVATQTILTQKAGPADYRVLRIAVVHRNILWGQLVAERKAFPLPSSPASFC